jgi:hypothetical protein
MKHNASLLSPTMGVFPNLFLKFILYFVIAENNSMEDSFDFDAEFRARLNIINLSLKTKVLSCICTC